MSEAHSYGKGVSGFDRTFGLPMRQFVPTLVRLADLKPGQRVLDFATGTGIAAEAALGAVGPTGHVTAADDTPAMLERARGRLGGRPNIAFAVERAGSLSFPDGDFDAVLCSMALMIFPDRGRALFEFHRVLRGGGRIAVSINTKPERSLTGRVRMAVARHVPSMRAALAHHYSLSDAAGLRAVLEAAGFRGVEVLMETRHFPLRSFESYFEPFEQGGGPWGAEYAALPAEARQEVKKEVRLGLERDGATAPDGAMEIGADILFGSGIK
ncbi:MAG: methyltransferase domain-containing protein [Acetobacteraceae bacterium]|nr:methyltransferase domain-containing protein [Acetobacteraceae bacterium]